jgi:hypothetical protein
MVDSTKVVEIVEDHFHVLDRRYPTDPAMTIEEIQDYIDCRVGGNQAEKQVAIALLVKTLGAKHAPLKASVNRESLRNFVPCLLFSAWLFFSGAIAPTPALKAALMGTGTLFVGLVAKNCVEIKRDA